MSTERTTIDIAGLSVGVARKPIKNLHIAVYPPDGHVRVSAPEQFDDEAVRLAIVERLSWIRRQRECLTGQPRQSPRELVSGETHYVWGRRYRLRVVETIGTSGVELAGTGTLRLSVPAGAVDQHEELPCFLSTQVVEQASCSARTCLTALLQLRRQLQNVGTDGLESLHDERDALLRCKARKLRELLRLHRTPRESFARL